jgi:hemerythrin-like metal-binding protein
MSCDRSDVPTMVIDELLSYADYHFKTEERIKKEIGYKDIDKHIEDHNGFRDKILFYKQKNHMTEHEICHDLILYLNRYIKDHMMIEDKKLTT